MHRFISTIATLALLTGLFAPLTAPPASACQCRISTAQEHVDRAVTIITGELVSLTYPNAVLDVDSYLKGSGPSELRVTQGPPDCGGFGDQDVGRRHLVFVVPKGPKLPGLDQWNTSYCAGTRTLGSEPGAEQLLSEVLAITGEGSPPIDAPAAASTNDDFPYLPAAAIALLIPALFLASALLPRR